MSLTTDPRFVADDRDIFVPGYDLDGQLLPFETYEALRDDLHASNAQSEEAIAMFIRGWLIRDAELRQPVLA